MRHQPENQDWTDAAARDHDSDRRRKPDQQKDTANPHVGHAAGHDQAVPSQGPGKGASRKRKLEDFNDREDLSERLFSDRNLL